MRIATVALSLLALPLAAAAQTEIYTSALSAANEVPPNASSATGSVTLMVNAVSRDWTLSGSYTGMAGNVTGSHIHTGVAGVNGPVLVTLPNTSGTSGTLSGAGTFSPSELSTLRASGLYVNVHTVAFPGGEIRDQLQRSTPSVDGTCSDPAYSTVAAHDGSQDGFGPSNTIGSLRTASNATTFFLCITGAVEANDNGFFVFLDASGYDGVDAGIPLPTAAGTGFFDGAGGTVLDTEADYGFFVGRNGSGNAYLIGARYGSTTVENSGFIVETNSTGTPGGAAAAPIGGTGTITQAFNNANTGTTGWEISIPLTALPGTDNMQMVRFFAGIAGVSAYFSNELLPDENYVGAADPGLNFGNDPNFDAVATTNPLYTASVALPVELSSFTAVADGAAAIVRWTTESETNNAGFDLQTLRSGAWTTVATAAGRGTTSERTRYEERVDGLAAGRHTFRLVQRDLDGTATIAGTVELVVGAANALVAEARGATVRFGAAAAQPLTVEAFDVLGRRVATLFAGAVEAGSVQSAELSGVAPGVYVVRVSGRTGVASTTLVVR